MHTPSTAQSPATALERRERRPTGTLLFLVALFALPIGTCGGIGASKAASGGREFVAKTVAELPATTDGTYVTFDATLRHVGTDELPLKDQALVLAPGTSVYSIEGVPSVYVAAVKGTLLPGSRVHVSGRICSPASTIVCSISNDGVGIFLRDEERRAGRRTKLVTSGATPRDNVVEAAIGICIAGILLLILGAVAALILRGRRKPFIFIERTVSVRDGFDPARVGALLGSTFRPAKIAADALVFLTGVPASRAQLVGAFRPDDFPQRVEICFDRGGGAYRQAQVRVRVSEIFAQPAGPLPQLMPSVNAALDLTLQRVLAALNS